MTSSARRVAFVRRWSFFVSAIWLMTFSGVFGFSNYSTVLKDVLGLNQKQLNRLSVAKDLGDGFGILAGILSNFLPAWGLLCIGAIVGLLGYGTQWLVASETIDPLPYRVMFIVCVVGGNCPSWINTATFTTAVKNFPRNTGPVVGLFKAYMGLSAAVFARICNLAFSSSESKYLLLQTVFPSTFCIIAACFMQPVPPAETEEDEKEEKRSILFFNLIAACLAICVATLNILSVETLALRLVAIGILFAVGVAAPVFVPLSIFCGMKKSSSSHRHTLEETRQIHEEEKKSPRNGVDDLSILRQPLLDTPRVKPSSKARSRRSCCVEPVPELGKDRSTLMLFRRWDFYVLYFSLLCGTGSGMTYNNNQGQLAESLGFTSVMVFTTFCSLGNFFGRIASGIVSEHFIRTAALPRQAWIGLAKLPLIAMFVWLSRGSGASLYATSVTVGICYGFLITLTLPTLSDFYGLKHFGINYMVTNTNILVGSALLSGGLAGYLYDKEAEKEGGVGRRKGWWNWLGSSDGTTTCAGSACYGETLLILAGLLSGSLVLDSVLLYVTRPLYKKLQQRNARLGQSSNDDDRY